MANAPHWQIGDVGAPDLVGPIHAQAAQETGIDLVSLGRPAGIGLLVDGHQAHQAHQPAYALLIYLVALVAQMPAHLAHAIERRLQELLVDLAHQS